jgi:hypothetical protein
MMDSNRVWYLAHLGATIVLAVLSAVSITMLALNSNAPLVNTFGGAIIFVYVVPGTLLVFAINQLILWRRAPRVIRTADKVVIVLVAVLILVAMLLTIDEELGFGAVFLAVPLLMIAGVISTIVLAVGNARTAEPQLRVTPVEPGTAPVAATLDELFPSQGAASAATPAERKATPDAPTPTPYGPQA